MPKTSPPRQTKAIHSPVKPTSAKTKRLTTIETAQRLLLPILLPYISGEPSTFTEAVRQLYDENLNQYYRLNKFLGPLLNDNEIYRQGMEISGAAPQTVRRVLKTFDRHKGRLAEQIVRLSSYGLASNLDKRNPSALPSIPEALIRLDAGYPEPFFRLLPLFGPLLLEKKEVQRAISSWFRLKDSENHSTRDCAQEFLARLGKALAYIKKGRRSPKRYDERRATKDEQDQFRKKVWLDDVRQEGELLRNQIDARINKIPPALARTKGDAYSQARRKAIADILNPASVSSNAKIRMAAKKLHTEYNR